MMMQGGDVCGGVRLVLVSGDVFSVNNHQLFSQL